MIVAAQRAKHILQGSRPYGNSRFTKETTIALDEVLRGEAKYLVGKEARDAMKEAKRGKEGETERMAMMTGGRRPRDQEGTQRLCGRQPQAG